MSKFNLFRLKIVNKKRQETFFEPNRAELLLKIIELRPNAFVRKKIEWIMANTQRIDNASVFFKFGRLTRESRDKYDSEKRLFIETEDDIVESTKCIYDSSNQVLAIEKCGVTPSPLTLSKYIMFIINNLHDSPLFQYLTKNEQFFLKLSHCQVDPIPNPFDFIDHLSSAYKITEFGVTFFRKNPIDFNELLERPTQHLLEETNGDKCSTEIHSEDGLKADPLIGLAHAAAASGSDASAKLQQSLDSTSEKLHLNSKHNIANIDYCGVHTDSQQELLELLDVIRNKYASIRGKDDN